MKNTYSEKLKHPKWQKKRLVILQRDDFKCCMCSDTESTLHVHHKNYIWGKNPWEYDDDNFQTLCELCHKAVEKIKVEACFLTPISSYKVDYPEEGITYLNMSTWSAEEGVAYVQVFRHFKNDLTHLVSLSEGTLIKQLEMIKEASTRA